MMANRAKSEKYVDFANKCLWLANQSSDQSLQTTLRQMAREWIDLAEAALSELPQDR
jgi:hypothetical protein